RTVTDRDLAGIARKDVEAEDRDEVDRDVADDSLVIAVEIEREDDDDNRHCEGRERSGEEAAAHTRRTCLRPKRPVGLRGRTISRITNAIGNRSSDVPR